MKARVYLEKTRKEYTAQFDQKKKDAIELEKELVGIISPAVLLTGQDLLQKQANLLTSKLWRD